MRDQIEIKPLFKTDIPHLLHLQPEDWNDIRFVFNQFIEYDFFYGVKAIFNEQIIGIGEILFNKNTAWIGVIVVDKKYRNQGIGSFITAHLSKLIASKNKTSQLLLATPLGQPVYHKLGFRHVSDYVFLKRRTGEKPLSFKANHKNIINYDPVYFSQIAALDQLAMGEDRSEILLHFTKDAKLFVDDQLEGFYLPNLGDGLIIANNNKAGFELLKIKWATKNELLILPAENLEIIEFAQSHGFEPFRYAAKMILGKAVDWNPQMIYHRVGGYLG